MGGGVKGTDKSGKEWQFSFPVPKTALSVLKQEQRSRAVANYIAFVHDGARLPSIWAKLQGQLNLGSEAFVRNMQAQIENKTAQIQEIPRAQRRALSQPLEEFEKQYSRHEAMARAYLSGRYSLAEIARHFGVHYSTVSRAVKSPECTESK